METDSWVIAYTTNFEAEAYLIKGFLDHNGIPCIIDAPSPFHLGEMSDIHLLVPSDKEIEATRMIEEHQDDKSVTCDNCGTVCDDNDNYCRYCGASFIAEDDEADFESGGEIN